jgi:hypothetical protein
VRTLILLLISCVVCAGQLAPAEFVQHKRKAFQQAGGGGGTCTPDYGNAGGTGDRTASITVTASCCWNGDLSHLVDGSEANADNYFSAQPTEGHYLQFDFGGGRIINEAQMIQSGPADHHEWKWQGSNNGSDFTDIGSSFQLTGATTITITALSGNTTAYRYYRMVWLSGTTSGGPWITEWKFKICTP